MWGDMLRGFRTNEFPGCSANQAAANVSWAKNVRPVFLEGGALRLEER